MTDNKKLKEFNQIQERITHFQEDTNLIKKNEDLKTLKQALENKEVEKDQMVDELKKVAKYGNYRSFDLTDETKGEDILLVSVPGESGKKRVNVGTLNNLVRQLNIIFALFECPFKDEGISDEEKVEIVNSILGDKAPSREVILDQVDAQNRKYDAEWELKDVHSNQNIREPETHSYEWFKRWWKFHKRFPQVEFAYGTSKKDFSEIDKDGKEKFPVLQEFPITEGSNVSNAEYRDPTKLIKEKKMWNWDWAKSRLFEPETKQKYLLIQSYLDTVPGQKIPVLSYNEFYSADFVDYFHTVFGNLDKNLLLTKESKFLLKPDEVRETYKYDILHMVTWQPKSGDKDDSSRDYDNHITEGIKGATNSLDGWNYLELNDDKPEYIHSFAGIKSGIEGAVEVVEEVFYKDKKVLKEIIQQAGGRTLTAPTEVERKPTNIYEENLKGKIPTNYQEVDSEIKQLEKDFSKLIETLKEEINRLESLQVQEQQAQILQTEIAPKK